MNANWGARKNGVAEPFGGPNPLGESEKLLPKCTSIVYRHRMIKDSGFRIRVQRDLREKFVEICRAQDRPAAQVLREYMRKYVAEHEAANENGSDDKKERNKNK